MKLATFKTSAAEGSTRVGLIVNDSILNVSSTLGVAEMRIAHQQLRKL